MRIFERPAVLAGMLLLLAGTTGLAGCFYSSTKETREKPVPSSVVVATPHQLVQRVYTYPDGRYELHGEGTASSPYYWVWIPSGVQSVPSPPPPPVPSRSAG
jgi:hypothetical protein